MKERGSKLKTITRERYNQFICAIMNILRLFVILVCGVIAAVCANTAPFYSLPGPYYFNGLADHYIKLTDLVCVKGNSARSIQFQMQTSSNPGGLVTIISMTMMWLIEFIHSISI